MWGGQDYPISQEFGHTDFSVRHHNWYSYGEGYGLDGYEHPGIDIGMPAGTPLYSPVKGTVKIAGGVPYYTYYGNGQPGVGELLIETANGDEVILGHMGLIVVTEGQKVKPGQFVGLSGGDNGDHLHLETRELQQGGWYRIVDPRDSFLVEAIAEEERPGDQAFALANVGKRWLGRKTHQ
jgi:murein DD-endopeptidase MepM/ murein hydrolase activator NlpD